MSIAKPFTFVANTYAKASEVNADFDTVYSQVNANISAIATNATDIDNLENNKADINGSSSQRFAVDNPVTNADAVNKRTLFKAIGNSIDYISGLAISKDSGSPEDTIIVSVGSCYDSTKSIVLSLDSAISKQNLNQGASTTYYVYIIGNDTGSSVDILISSSSTTPTLPSGYTKYRQIGHYTTNSSSKIEYIYQQDSTNPVTKATIIDTYINGTSWYRIWSDGWIEQGGTSTTGATLTGEIFSLLKKYSNTNYVVVTSVNNDSAPANFNSRVALVHSKTTSSYYIVGTYNAGGAHYPYSWYACGY